MLDQTSEALEEATVDNAIEESQTFFKILDKRIDKWITEKKTFHIKHAIFTRNHVRMNNLQVCPKEDYIPVLIDRACVCRNCSVLAKCFTGKSYKFYLEKNLDKIELNSVWKPIEL